MFNKAILIGRLAADPELKTTPKGVNVSTFRIAVNRPRQKDGESKADYITIVAWRQQAEFVCRYFSKGKAIGVEGSIQTRDYTDKDGNRKYLFEVKAEHLFFVGNKEASSPGADRAPKDSAEFLELDDEDDLPF